VYSIETDANGKITGQQINTGMWARPKDLEKFITGEFSKGWIEEGSIVAYNDKFYEESKAKSKSDFIKELGSPKYLFIHPYRWNKTGNMERSLLDCLGGEELKRKLGEFFTPDPYVEISTRYLRNAIKDIEARMKKGEFNDYVIIDRSAGTGNLEKFLDEEELSHCILNTYVYAEWTTLRGVFGTDENGLGGRVRMIIPHTAESKVADGTLTDGDALAEPFYNPTLFKPAVSKMWDYVNDPKCAVIMLENPPYVAPGKNNNYVKKNRGYVVEQMSKNRFDSSQATNDICNAFIWSAFEMLKPQYYIVFAPIKYWKSHHIVSPVFVEGHLCNRKYFHASEASIALISWRKGQSKSEEIIMDSDLNKVSVKKVHHQPSDLYDRTVKNGFAAMYADSFSLDGKKRGLTNNKDAFKALHTTGVWLEKTNLLSQLPLFVAGCYSPANYTEMEVLMKTSDGGTKYRRDVDFLNDCLFWSCITADNKCKSDKKLHNELCLNQDTEANKLFQTKRKHHKILGMWQKLLDTIKTTDEFNPKYTYGLDQICKEIDIKEPSGNHNKKGEPIMVSKNPEVTEQVKDIKTAIKEFYREHIAEKLLEYQLLK
jgi:bisphosphoglycerate-dependent phosphoglycerate mutase